MNKHRFSKQTAVKLQIIIGCFVMIFVGLGFCCGNKSLYLSAITDALDIKRSLFSIKDSIRYVITAILNLFFGTLIQKFGPKKLVAAGFLSLIVYFLICSVATTVWAFYLAGCFLGIGLAWTSTAMSSYLVSLWFHENRGTVNGMILCANGIGSALAAQVVSPILYKTDDPFGYRKVFLLFAVLLLITGFVTVCLIRKPKDDEVSAGKTVKASGNTWVGLGFSEALKRPYFYGTAICIFSLGMCLQGVNSISAAHLLDAGISERLVAIALSTQSILLASAKILTGFFYDKIGIRSTYILCCSCGFGAFLFLANASVGSFGNFSMFAWAVLFALSLPLETVVIPLTVMDLFGEKDFSKILGIFLAMISMGSILASPLANLVYDLFGSYRRLLISLACVMMTVLIIMLVIISKAKRLRKTMEADETQGQAVSTR